MPAHNEQPLENVIRDFLKIYNLEQKMDEVKLINSWESVVGKMIAKHTNDLHIRKKTLFVYLDSDALRNELAYTKSLLMSKLNESAGKPLIKDIVFR
jgi:predicted nucleic acid-binding Zn ribbon protein